MDWLSALVAELKMLGYGQTAAIPLQFAVAVKSVDKRSISIDHATALDIYRDYYVRDKRAFATWKKRMKPMWYLLREEHMDWKAGI